MSLDPRLRSPRRILTALTIAVLLGGTGWTVLGVAGAQGEGGSSDPHDAQLPDIRVGDRTGWHSRHFDKPDGPPVMTSVWTAEWLPTTSLLDAYGMPQQAMVLELRRTDEWHADTTHTGGWASTYEHVQHGWFDIHTRASLAGTVGTGHARASSGDDTQIEAQVSTHRFGHETLPCGLLHSAQGGPLEEVRLRGACGTGGDVPLRFVAEEPWQDGLAWHYRHADGTDAVDAWFVAGSAYPVRLVLTSEGETYGRVETEMTGLKPGEGEASPAPAAAPAPLPPVALTELPLQGPAEDPLGRVYGIREALQDAELHPDGAEYRAFVAEHPDWYLASASAFDQPQADGTRTSGWYLALQAETKTLQLLAFRTQPSLLGTLPLPDNVSQTGLPEVMASAMDAENPPASAIQIQVPDVAGVAEAWQVYDRTDAPARYWGFERARCSQSACDAPPLVWAGDAPSIALARAGGPLTLADLLLGRDSFENATSLLHTGGDAAYGWMRHMRYSSHEGLEGIVLPSGPSSGADGRPGLSLLAALPWGSAPPGAVAGFSLLALVVAAAYWLAPLAKGAPAMGLFSRVRRNRVLDHPVRAQVMDAVTAEPGIHYQQLVRRTELSKGQVEHHLGKLVEAGLVVRRPGSGYTCHFPAGRLDASRMDAAAVLKAPGARAVLAAVQRVPGCTARVVGERAGLAPATVHRHIGRLVEAGLLERRRADHGAFALHATGLALRLAAA